jgi:hypothetical protein
MRRVRAILLLLTVFSLPALAHERPVPPPSIDAGAVAIIWPKGTDVGHGPNVPRGVVANYGTDTEDIPATFRIYDSTGRSVCCSSVVETLAPGQIQNYYFAMWTAITGNNYTACLQTTLAGDQNLANDTLSQVFSVFSGTRDVGVDKIYEPTAPYMDSLDFAPSVDVQNYGDLTESFYIYMRITYLGNNMVVYYDSFPVTNIVAHTDEQVTFQTWAGHKVPGTYVATAWTLLSADQNHSNDSLIEYTQPNGDVLMYEWRREADVPQGPRAKGVKDGAQLAYTVDAGDSQFVWCLKGNNTNEFYCYQVEADSGAWQAADSLPLVSQQRGKTRRVKKGSVLVAGTDGMIYAAKGGGSDEWWQYNPAHDTGQPGWVEEAMVPLGMRALEQGAGAVAVSINGHSYVYLLKGSETTEFYRYDCGANTWAPMAAAPLGASGKPFRDGSCLAYDPTMNLIYCLKGHYDEFFAYSVDGDTWLNPLPMLPVIGLTGKPKEAKSGAAMTWLNREVYALKGDNTDELFAYDPSLAYWHWDPQQQYPLGSGKKVGLGGALISAPDAANGLGALFSTKGNNTAEFWECVWLVPASTPPLPENIEAERTAPTTAQWSITPNPFKGTTRINYSVPKSGPFSLRLYDATGRLARTVKQGYCNAGYTFAAILDASQLARGIYLLKFNSEGYSSIQKLVLE